MITALIVGQVLAWLVILILGVAILALARQVGVLHMRVAPAGALQTSGGPAAGGKAPAIPATTLDGQDVVVGGPASGVPLRLLMFVSSTCPLCKNLIPAARSFARDERVELTFVGDDDIAVQRAMVEAQGLAGYRFVNGQQVGQAFEVAKLPYAVLLDTDGVILSKGLVNSREHLESLIVAHELGIATVQDYIARLRVEAA